jgi:predicted restriction endonuclease
VARRTQAKFRAALIAASGGQCAYTGCTETQNLEAAHIGGRYADGAGFDRGAMLCPTHHHLLDHGA